MRWSQDCPSNLAVLKLLLMDGGFAITELLAFIVVVPDDIDDNNFVIVILEVEVEEGANS